MNFLNVMSEHWAINVEQVSHINIDQNTIYLYINDAEEPSIRIECENEKAAQSFFTLWQIRINDSKEKKQRKATQMTNKEKMKCIWCKKELTTNDIVISSNTFAYCKKCKKPMLDMLIQPPEHFLKRHEKEIEHDEDIHLMLKGFM